MAEPRVVVVILNYCRWKDTSDCIRSFGDVTYPNYELLVVDNASPDGSEAKLRAAFPGLRIVPSGGNLGYTGGVNVGIRAALALGCDYVLLINEDTLVTPEFLGRMVSAMEEHPRAAAAGGTIYHHPETSKVWYAGGRMIPWRGLAVHDTRVDRDARAPRTPVRVSFITGCLVMLRASALPVIGLKDERFFMSLEDIEHCARILRLGFDLLYVPDAVIYHRIPVRYESRFNLYYSVRNRLLLIDAALPALARSFARAYFLAVITAKLALWRWSNPPYFAAARAGLDDYFAGRFHEGRGVAEFTRP